MSPVTSVVFSPDGNFVAAGSQLEHTVRVFDVATGQSAAELKVGGDYLQFGQWHTCLILGQESY